MWAASVLAKFPRSSRGQAFKRVDDPRILFGVLWTARDIGETEFFQIIRDDPFGTRDIKAIFNHGDEIDAPPAHNTVFSPVRPRLHNL